MIDELKEKNQQISLLQEKLSLQESDLRTLKDKIFDLQRNLELYSGDNREIKRIAQEKINKTQAFQEKIDDLTEKLNERDFEYGVKIEELAFLNEKMKEFKNRNRDLEAEILLIKNHKSGLENDLHGKLGIEAKNIALIKEKTEL